MPQRLLVDRFLGRSRSRTFVNPSRERLIADSLSCGYAQSLPSGALATWTRPDSTGRSPKDTYIVRRTGSEASIDWKSPNCIPCEPETAEMLLGDALETLLRKPRLYALRRSVGADSSYALPLQVLTDSPLAGVFVDNMFRPVPPDIDRSIFAGEEFYLIVVPNDKLPPRRYEDRMRRLADGTTSTLAVVMDMDERIGIVYGSSYMGSIKKLIFTVMSYLLPERGILPLHCAANEGPDGSSALLLGLSGTGKTTLSTDPQRKMIGDDEHAWSDDGVANLEWGCYPKLINLSSTAEPEIFQAVFHDNHPSHHGAIVENLMIYPDGSHDLCDDRLTPNSRASFPLSYFANAKASARTGHPSAILFLTADASGVLPPVARLSPQQAMFWFMMGYTSKVAGTETGLVDPEATFSRFFGQPFMPRKPDDYTSLLREKISAYRVPVYLVNTGWVGGSFGVGHRIEIALTREIVRAALVGRLEGVAYRNDPFFKVAVPLECPGISPAMLNPAAMWKDGGAFDKAARRLARQFREHFDRAFAGQVDRAIAEECPVG